MAYDDNPNYNPDQGQNPPPYVDPSTIPPPTANTPPQPPTSGIGTGTVTNGPQMPQGIDPRLAALYQKANLTPGGQGSGFADWQYWQDKMNSGDPNYFLDRLGKDLAGTGTDQPTGTPGQGAWSSSGQGQGQQSPPTMLSFTPQPYSPITGVGPNQSTPNSFWAGMSPAQFGTMGNQVPASNLTNQSSNLLSTLLSRMQIGPNGIKF